MRKRFYFFILAVVALIGINSCSDSTASDDDKTTFKGKVTLQGQTDHSGITVSLYAPVALDTALVRINKEYPNIGVQISQETEFDHRAEKAIASTTTKADGSWSIDVKPGSYNVVAHKENYGWHYSLENSGSTVNMGLKQVIEVSGINSNGYTFNDANFYKLNGEVSILGNISFGDATILCGNNAKLILYGAATGGQSGGTTLFTAQDIEEVWDGITIEAENTNLSHLRIKHARQAIKVKKANNQFSHIYISDADRVGIVNFSQFNNNVYRNILVSNSPGGVEFSLSDNTVILEKSIIILANEKALYLNNANAHIKNNLFYKNEIAILNVFDSDSKIENCEFKKNILYDIQIGGSEPVIKNNNLYSKSERAVFVSRIGYAGPSIPIIQSNNINGAKYNIYIVGDKNNSNHINISAINNWWGTDNTIEIENKIFDKMDFTAGHPSYQYTGVINYQPFKAQAISTVGIQ